MEAVQALAHAPVQNGECVWGEGGGGGGEDGAREGGGGGGGGEGGGGRRHFLNRKKFYLSQTNVGTYNVSQCDHSIAFFPAKEGESLVHFIMCVTSRVDLR